jgi:hypothetical protein
MFAPAHPWRRRITGARAEPGGLNARKRAAAHRCRRGRSDDDAASSGDGDVSNKDADFIPMAPQSWAERLKRVFGIEITVCPHCGGRLRVIADVTDPEAIGRILEHVRREGLPRAPPSQRDRA